MRSTVFAERAMRLRQLARGHAMWDFLLFMADLAQAQQDRLEGLPGVALPDADALDRAAQRGAPPLDAADWPRDPVWHGVAAPHRRRPARPARRRAPGAGGARREQRRPGAPGRLPAHRRDGGPGPGHRAAGGGGTAGLLDAHGHHADAARRRPRPALRPHRRRDHLPLLRQPAGGQHHAQQRRVARPALPALLAVQPAVAHGAHQVPELPVDQEHRLPVVRTGRCPGRRRPLARRQRRAAGRDLRRLRAAT
ncbi:MAG: formate dehydrogenase accessory protein FdhE [Piscinibacter sp.]|nr:formate dehydrogenase accessory protein FdhE [Piscinibacter sp.]